MGRSYRAPPGGTGFFVTPKPKTEAGKKPVPKQKGPAFTRKLDGPRKGPSDRCESCGHWSPATEYGVDEKSGYCNQWEKLTSRDFWCEEYVSREKYKQIQDQLAEENEEYLDEENG